MKWLIILETFKPKLKKLRYFSRGDINVKISMKFSAK